MISKNFRCLNDFKDMANHIKKLQIEDIDDASDMIRRLCNVVEEVVDYANAIEASKQNVIH